MKSILLHVAEDRGMEARMQVALDLARAFDARLTCLQPVIIEVYAPGDFYGTAASAVAPMVREAADNLGEKVKAQLANEDVSWDWVRCDGEPQLQLLAQSALHDLILIGDHDSGEIRGPSRMAGELALHAKCPVMVVPDGTKRFDVSAPVMIAWNGSPEACVALRGAVPLLAKSGKVMLVTVGESKKADERDFPSLAGLQYLAHYGIDVELIELPAGDEPVADVLSKAATTRKCGLMVMGAYGRSRLTELLLGGVTRKALSEPDLPILLAH